MELGPLVKVLFDSPLWLAGGLFLIVMLESLLVVGYLVPAASLVFLVGALGASNPVLLLPAFAGAAGGALVGGAANYELGCRLRHRTDRLWPFSHHPGLLERNQAFLARHGAVSLIVSRFAKPTRSTLPAVAGMLDMDRRLFLFGNLLSAPLWAAVWLGLGLGAGTSVAVVLGEAGRVALPFLTAAVLLAGFGWLWGRRRLRRGLPSGARHWRMVVILLVTLAMVASVLEVMA
ncbi:DedA family protein [Alkalilimnicola ehrlichii]|uniref:DedA family protein n=1 Tax=Alkalilimnicola ehrlichii TaxID=351052 RepID=UPI003BA0A67A